VKLTLVCRALALDWRELVRAIVPTGLAVGGMVLGILAIWTLAAAWPDIAIAVACVVSGVALYGAVVAVLAGGTVREIRQAAASVLRG
jgi:hypothetical protein